jgi:hypothetical protein
VPDALAGARVACIAERGMTQAVEALAADGCELTENQRFWVEVGVAHGILATLQTLSEAGWITGPA